jgi:hypothetical protein
VWSYAVVLWSGCTAVATQLDDGDADGPVPESHKAAVGAACAAAADCAAPLNICNEDPGGQCTKNCSAQADSDGVPNAVCETDRPGHCYRFCTSKADCPREGYDCLGGPNPEGKKWCDVIPADAGN